MDTVALIMKAYELVQGQEISGQTRVAIMKLLEAALAQLEAERAVRAMGR